MRFWVLVLAGCAGPPDNTVSPIAEEPVETPTPYIYDDVDSGSSAEFDQSAIEAAMSDAVSSALALNASPALRSYEAAMAGASDDCPDYYTDGTNVYWYDYCTSTAGASFSGYSFYYAYDAYYDGYMTYYGEALYAEASIETVDGQTFTGGGSATLLEGPTDDGGYVYYSDLAGDFSWDGEEAEGTWMEDGVGAELNLWIASYAEYDYTYAYVSGGITGLGEGDSTVSFTEVQIAAGPQGWWVCPEEPSGTISVRGEDGSWFDVVFDVTYAEDGETLVIADGACDGCGTVWHRGEEVGSACADLSPLVASGSPW